MITMKTLKMVAIVSGLLTLFQLIGPLITMAVKGIFDIRSSSSIGIIGGADGPTAIYVATLPNIVLRYGFFVICASTAVVSTILILVKKKK